MKRLILAALFVAAACSPRETYTTGSFDVSPLPRTVSADTTAAPFVFNGSTVIVCDEGLEDAAGLLSEGLLEATGLVVPVSDRSGKNAVELHIDHAVGEGLEDWRREESYLIESGEEGLRISGFSVIGVIHGIQTVLKALPVGGEGLRALPAARVEDWPEFAFRGFMLDVGRHFFGKDYILKLIDILSLHNINYFHWHLSEDQGWRIEIKKYPLLTEIGSYRSGSPVKGAEGHDGVPVSGFYTQEEAREVVSYAAARGITVIPEIDLPGHMQAALASYPSLGCTGGPYEVATQYGVLDDVLCVGKDGTLGFVKDVLSELLEIFPSPYFHLGGDECPKVRWEKCPDCQAKIRELGLSDFGGISAEDRLQSWFMAEAEAFLAENGRVMIGWNDILCDWSDKVCGTPAKTTVIGAWMRPESAAIAAREGYKTIMCPVGYFYFSNAEQNQRTGLSSIARVYELPVIPEGLSDAEAANVIGAEACIWTERVADTELLEWELLPRLAALAELQWSAPKQHDIEAFLPRLKKMTEIYTARGWNWKQDIAEAWE